MIPMQMNDTDARLCRRACPCGSGLMLADCCQPLHDGATAATPEALMRSRYSAFALGRHDYLLNSWHSTTRPAELNDDDTHWVRLEIVDSGVDESSVDESGGDSSGHVHFRALFCEGPAGRIRWGMLEERSRFLREQGHWRYVDGRPLISRLKPGRNDACPCGSGRKLKQCCGR